MNNTFLFPLKNLKNTPGRYVILFWRCISCLKCWKASAIFFRDGESIQKMKRHNSKQILLQYLNSSIIIMQDVLFFNRFNMFNVSCPFHWCVKLDHTFPHQLTFLSNPNNWFVCTNVTKAFNLIFTFTTLHSTHGTTLVILGAVFHRKRRVCTLNCRRCLKEGLLSKGGNN